MAHNIQVVGDDHDRKTQLVLKPAQQIEHLALDRHVQTGRRLVRDQQFRIQRQRPRDAHTPRLPARDLIGIARGKLRRQADHGQKPPRLGIQITILHALNAKGFGDQRLDRQTRRQRADRILEHHHDLAAQLAELRLGQVAQLLPAIADRPCRGMMQTRHRARQRGLARAAFANDAIGLALIDGQADARDRIDAAGITKQSAPHTETHHDIVQFQQRAHALTSALIR